MDVRLHVCRNLVVRDLRRAVVIHAFSSRIAGWKADTSSCSRHSRWRSGLVTITASLSLTGSLLTPMPGRNTHRLPSPGGSSTFADPRSDLCRGRIEQRPAESTIGLYKSEPIKPRGPSKTVDQVALPPWNGSTGTTAGGYTQLATDSLPSSSSRRGRASPHNRNRFQGPRSGSLFHTGLTTTTRAGHTAPVGNPSPISLVHNLRRQGS